MLTGEETRLSPERKKESGRKGRQLLVFTFYPQHQFAKLETETLGARGLRLERASPCSPKRSPQPTLNGGPWAKTKALVSCVATSIGQRALSARDFQASRRQTSFQTSPARGTLEKDQRQLTNRPLRAHSNPTMLAQFHSKPETCLSQMAAMLLCLLRNSWHGYTMIHSLLCDTHTHTHKSSLVPHTEPRIAKVAI